jgi:RES domain-containing protein
VPDMRVWRIGVDTATYPADDSSGRGAEITGGRWNRPGVPMLYASSSRALACLETVVHLSGGLQFPLNRYLVELTIPHAVWESRSICDAKVHVGWDACPVGLVSLDWGSGWAGGSPSAVAEVPSVVIPEEWNVLINPRHAQSASIVVRKVRRWTYDARLLPAQA